MVTWPLASNQGSTSVTRVRIAGPETVTSRGEPSQSTSVGSRWVGSSSPSMAARSAARSRARPPAPWSGWSTARSPRRYRTDQRSAAVSRAVRSTVSTTPSNRLVVMVTLRSDEATLAWRASAGW